MSPFISKEVPALPNFSYHRIRKDLTIPDGQHMLVSQFEVLLDGSLEIELDAGVILI